MSPHEITQLLEPSNLLEPLDLTEQRTGFAARSPLRRNRRRRAATAPSGNGRRAAAGGKRAAVGFQTDFNGRRRACLLRRRVVVTAAPESHARGARAWVGGRKPEPAGSSARGGRGQIRSVELARSKIRELEREPIEAGCAAQCDRRDAPDAERRGGQHFRGHSTRCRSNPSTGGE
jgi:hypothetical protein